jgi:hypothetical protein
MKNITIYRLFMVYTLLLFWGCASDKFNMDDYQSKIVVDGWIEQGHFPQVLLTLSAPYFSEIDSVSLRNYSLTRAKVTISDGEHEEILTLKPNDAYFPPYIYVGSRLRGQTGKTYQLEVIYGGVTAYATTTIPEPVKLDSTYFALEEGHDSLGFIYVKFIDDINKKNYYRTLTKINGEDAKYIPTYFANFNDAYFNGEPIEVGLFKGNKSSIDKTDDIYFAKGDTIMLKFCAIDKASFDFWDSFHKEIMNTGNPFAATNARVESNVTNGLGVWCGYGAAYYKIIAH